MYATRVSSKAFVSKHAALQISQAVCGSSLLARRGTSVDVTGLRLPTCTSYNHEASTYSSRPFSSTSTTRLKDTFPKPNSPGIRVTDPAWPHPLYAIFGLYTKLGTIRTELTAV